MNLQNALWICLHVAIATLRIGGPTARAQHVDISPRLESGKIVADAIDDATEMIVATNVAVFGYDFQEDPFDPFVIQDPGFDAIDGSGLPVGGRFGFDLANGSDFGLAGNAVYWDGTGSPDFGVLPDGVSLSLSFVGQSVTVSNTPGPQAGFFLDPPITAGGAYHQHLVSTLSGATLVDDDGIYLIGVELKIDSDGSEPLVGDLFSDPLWIVFNNGLGEEIHDEAIDWVQTNLVEPSGDLNADGFVGQDDLNIVLANWGRNVTPNDPLMGDASGDGFVGQDDLNGVLGGWGQGTPPTLHSPVVVPEPVTLLLVLTAVATLSFCRR